MKKPYQIDLSALCGYLPKPKKALSAEEINHIIENKKNTNE